MPWTLPTFLFEQSVAPNTTWFPTVVNYQGDPVIERRISEEIASFGKQLGIVSEALIEVAADRRHGPKFTRLCRIVDEIEKLKDRQHRSLVDETTRSFEALVKEDPEKARRLADTLLNLAKDEQRKQR